MAARSFAAAVAAAAALVVATGGARAEDKAWAAGVPADKQAAALALYREGNALFERSACVEALVRYDRALAQWDHPAIRYNAAVCLIDLDRPVEAYEYLERALRFGPEPLGPELYKQGQTYQKLLAGRLGELEVVCDERGAQVTLDGKPLLVGPGRAKRRLLPGAHQIVGAKPDYQTETRSVDVVPGKRAEVAIAMRRLDAPPPLERRWKPWVPWVVVAGGAAFGLAGVPLWLKARSDYADYDDAVEEYCPDGCMVEALPPDQRDRLHDLESTAKVSRGLAYTAIAIGAVGIATGITMVILNQPRTAIVPTVTGDHAGLVISGRW